MNIDINQNLKNIKDKDFAFNGNFFPDSNISNNTLASRLENNEDFNLIINNSNLNLKNLITIDNDNRKTATNKLPKYTDNFEKHEKQKKITKKMKKFV